MASSANRSDYGSTVFAKPHWIQVNNTLVPCVYRDHKPQLPLNVLQYSARILTDLDRDGHDLVTLKQATTEERMRLSGSCTGAGLQFPHFPKSTLLISLNDLYSLIGTERLSVKSLIKEISSEEPWNHVEYLPDLDAKVQSKLLTQKTGFPSQKATATTTTTKHLLKKVTSYVCPRKSSGNTFSKRDSTISEQKGVTGKPISESKQKRLSQRISYEGRNKTTNQESQAFPTSSVTKKNIQASFKADAASMAIADMKITLINFYGKSIPCVVYDFEVYASTDSLHKIYFNSGSVDDLNDVLQTVTKIPLVCLNEIVNLVMMPADESLSKKTLSYVKLKDIADKMEELQSLLKTDSRSHGLKDGHKETKGKEFKSCPDVPLDLSHRSQHNPPSGEFNSCCHMKRPCPKTSARTGTCDQEALEQSPDEFQRSAVDLRVTTRITTSSPPLRNQSGSGEAVKKRRRLENAIYKIVQDKSGK